MKATPRQAAVILSLIVTLVAITACQTKTETESPNADLARATPQAATNSSQPQPAKTETSLPPMADSQATPTAAYQFGYAARQNKDLAALKRVLSKDAQEFLTEIGKEEQKTLDDQLRTLAERPQARTAESRNEKISGNRASLEYLNETGKWVSMEFVKEGNDWKIDLPKAP